MLKHQMWTPLARLLTLVALAAVLTLPAFLTTLALPQIAFAQEAEWSYSGENGPDHWGELDPAYSLCATGKEQSPVDIAGTAPANPPDLAFDYRPSAVVLQNTGHTVMALYDAGSSVTIDGARYILTQFHFHNPSEHTVDGVASPMELHLVHSDPTGEVALISVLLEEGAEKSELNPIFDNLPTAPGVPITVTGGVRINAADLLPDEPSYWRYPGSLTTPPCTEGVKWLVMTEPLELSQEQIDAFAAVYSGNVRPVQPWNDRNFILVTGSWSRFPGAATPAPEEEATDTGEATATAEATEEATAEAAATAAPTEEAPAVETPVPEEESAEVATETPTETPAEEAATAEAATATATAERPTTMPVTGRGTNPLAIFAVITGTLVVLLVLSRGPAQRKPTDPE